MPHTISKRPDIDSLFSNENYGRSLESQFLYQLSETAICQFHVLYNVFFQYRNMFLFNIYFHSTMLSKFYHFNCCHLPSFVFQPNFESWCYCELIMHAKQNILLSRKQGKRTFNVKLLCSTEIISSGISSCSRQTDLTYISKPS